MRRFATDVLIGSVLAAQPWKWPRLYRGRLDDAERRQVSTTRSTGVRLGEPQPAVLVRDDIRGHRLRPASPMSTQLWKAGSGWNDELAENQSYAGAGRGTDVLQNADRIILGLVVDDVLEHIRVAALRCGIEVSCSLIRNAVVDTVLAEQLRAHATTSGRSNSTPREDSEPFPGSPPTAGRWPPPTSTIVSSMHEVVGRGQGHGRELGTDWSWQS